MEPAAYFKEGSDTPAFFECPNEKCAKLYTVGTMRHLSGNAQRDADEAKRMAIECCSPTPKFCNCGNEIDGRWWTACFQCRERNKLSKCQVVEWDGDCMVYSGDQFWSSPDDVADSFYPEIGPAYVHPTTFSTFQIDLGSVLEAAGEEHHEEIHCDYEGDANLIAVETAVNKFNEETKAGSWNVDYSRVIVLDTVRFAEIMKPVAGEAA